MKTTVISPFYDQHGRKYMDIEFQNKIQRVKVPWRYGRVMCRIEGDKTVQELKKGDEFKIEIEKKIWEGIEYLIVKKVWT